MGLFENKSVFSTVMSMVWSINRVSRFKKGHGIVFNISVAGMEKRAERPLRGRRAMVLGSDPFGTAS